MPLKSTVVIVQLFRLDFSGERSGGIPERFFSTQRARDLQIIAKCFEKSKEVSMKDFVDAFDSLLTREQVKTLIYKLESEELIEKTGGGRSVKYTLNQIIPLESNIFKQFTL